MEIDDLHYYYKDKIVLDGVTLDIRKGEILGILGPNGCGKTTLLGNLNKNLSPKLGRYSSTARIWKIFLRRI